MGPPIQPNGEAMEVSGGSSFWLATVGRHREEGRVRADGDRMTDRCPNGRVEQTGFDFRSFVRPIDGNIDSDLVLPLL